MELLAILATAALALVMGFLAICAAIAVGQMFVQAIGYAAYGLASLTRKPRRPATPDESPSTK